MVVLGVTEARRSIGAAKDRHDWIIAGSVAAFHLADGLFGEIDRGLVADFGQAGKVFFDRQAATLPRSSSVTSSMTLSAVAVAVIVLAMIGKRRDASNTGALLGNSIRVQGETGRGEYLQRGDRAAKEMPLEADVSGIRAADMVVKVDAVVCSDCTIQWRNPCESCWDGVGHYLLSEKVCAGVQVNL